MPCPSCGQPVDAASRFCPNCGASLAAATKPGAVPPPYTPPAGYSAAPGYAPARPELIRPRSGRMIAGVCAAFARTYGWNVTLLRILLVVLTPLHLGLGFLAYIIAWVVIPEDPILLPPPGRV